MCPHTFFKKMNTFFKKTALFWASIAPGIFLVGYNIGTGSITTMASAGSEYGMTLTWALALSCIFTYVLIIAFSRYTMTTGQTTLHAFRQYFGSPITIFILISLIFSEITSSMGVMGVITEVVKEWSRPLTFNGEGFNTLVVGIIFAILLGYICWQGKQRFFENILFIFVFIMGISFLLTMFIVIPSPETILSGLKPSIPNQTNALMIASGMVGTTMGAVLFVVRSTLVSEKGWTMSDMKIQKRDAFISVAMMFFLSFAILACAARAVYGEEITNAIQMVKLMEPLAGNLATSIFVAGIVSAGLSSLFPILLLAPWLISDYKGAKCNLKAPWVRLLIFAGLLCSLAVPVFGGRPVKIMIFSQTLCLIASPLVILFMAILLNRKKLMGKYISTFWQNVIYGIIFLFTFVMTVVGVVGIKELLS